MHLDVAKSHTHARRNRLSPSWKTRACLIVAGVALVVPELALAEIRPVVENGRVIYTNDETGPIENAKSRQSERQAAPARRFIYWSVTERRWKPVPVPSVGALREARSAAAEVTSYVESQPVAKGVTPKPAAVAAKTPYAGLTAGRLVTSAEVDKAINDAAQRHGVDANLVRAVIQIESGFNPRAVSRKGALGLMQLMPTTARSLNVQNPFDPAQNVDAGVRHLKGLLQNYKGDVPLSLAAYNAGAGAVARSGNNIPPFAETREYVRRITSIYGGAAQQSFRSFGSRLHMERDERGVLKISNTD